MLYLSKLCYLSFLFYFSGAWCSFSLAGVFDFFFSFFFHGLKAVFFFFFGLPVAVVYSRSILLFSVVEEFSKCFSLSMGNVISWWLVCCFSVVVVISVVRFPFFEIVLRCFLLFLRGCIYF